MNKTQRSWNYDGKIIHESQVQICEAEEYLRLELFEPLEALFTMMSNQKKISSTPTQTAGRIGKIATTGVIIKMMEFFDILIGEDIKLEVIISTEDTPGTITGEMVTVDVLKRGEVIS